MKSFPEIASIFKNWLTSNSIAYELLELHSIPYSFGSGFIVYKINGRNVKIVYDGRDNIVSIYVSPIHNIYPCNNWELRFEGNSEKYQLFDLNLMW